MGLVLSWCKGNIDTLHCSVQNCQCKSLFKNVITLLVILFCVTCKHIFNHLVIHVSHHGSSSWVIFFSYHSLLLPYWDNGIGNICSFRTEIIYKIVDWHSSRESLQKASPLPHLFFSKKRKRTASSVTTVHRHLEVQSVRFYRLWPHHMRSRSIVCLHWGKKRLLGGVDCIRTATMSSWSN